MLVTIDSKPGKEDNAGYEIKHGQAMEAMLVTGQHSRAKRTMPVTRNHSRAKEKNAGYKETFYIAEQMEQCWLPENIARQRK